MANIPEDYIEDARSILQWLAVSERPLSLQEVAEAAVLRPGDNPIDPDERFYDSSDVLRICRGLVSLSKEWLVIRANLIECNVVRFAHFSVQEYLMSGRAGSFSISPKLADTYVGESCVSYLLHMDHPNHSEQCLDGNPLLQYAAQYWFGHVRRIVSKEKISNENSVSLRAALEPLYIQSRSVAKTPLIHTQYRKPKSIWVATIV